MTIAARCRRAATLIMCLATGVLALLLGASPVHAGVMTQAELARRFPAPLSVGERDAELPVWPLFRQGAGGNVLAGYVFESSDLAPIPGFSGVPVNLLVAIDPAGRFIGVEVLSQHEPVFQYGLGEAPLFEFVRQYRGVSLRQNIHIENQASRARQPEASRVTIDGISKATVSVRIINESVLAAALLVSRRKLGFGAGKGAARMARVRPDVMETLSFKRLQDDGLLRHLRVSNREMEQRYAGSDGARLDEEGLRQPDAIFIDLYLACVSVPAVARSLLTEASVAKLKPWIEAGDQAMLVISSGRHRVPGDDFTRGGIPDRLLLRQHQLAIDLRDLDLDLKLLPGIAVPPDASLTVFRIPAEAGLDPGAAFDFSVPVTRSKGQFYPERIVRELPVTYRIPSRFLIAAPGGASWHAAWQAQRMALLILAGGLAVLAVALSLPRKISANGRRFHWFRGTYLLFTIGFIGCYAQAQLSIVNLTGVIQALVAGRSLSFLLHDPMTVALWGYVLLSLLLWGRGTFCGWLCPFGALQELTGKLARLCKLPQLKLSRARDARLKLFKYGALALILASAVTGFAVDTLVELEPFKTAITLNFVRAWPYAAYALALLAASAVVHKFFCRYLCPLGASLALLGRFRLLDWIPRRSECGTPCQTCRHRCDYQAITPDGAVVYAECFQCMDCVVIHESEQRCAPRLLDLKRTRTIPIHAVPGGAT
ncbi:4Fe-4S binding protein [Janthinobacterium sp. RB2R34]|uniref:4Fe-4S binding protein n=1 Tax=Janthinobacterium sp. RB2R34 TaxID=3424193 RepID=UPI003F29349A